MAFQYVQANMWDSGKRYCFLPEWKYRHSIANTSQSTPKKWKLLLPILMKILARMLQIILSSFHWQNDGARNYELCRYDKPLLEEHKHTCGDMEICYKNDDMLCILGMPLPQNMWGRPSTSWKFLPSGLHLYFCIGLSFII